MRGGRDEWKEALTGDLLFGAVLFLLAFAPRLIVAVKYAHEPVWDGHYYDFGARRIAAGFGYSDDLGIDGVSRWHPWCHYPVGYSAVLALFYVVFGATTHVVPAVNALTGAGLAVVTWRLGRHALSDVRARVAGVLVAVHPGLVLYSALVMTEPLAALLTLGAFLLAVRDPRPRRGAAIGGLALGFAALVRPQALLCAPFLAVVERGKKRMLAAGALACALALVPILPWTARNCRVMDGCALISTNGGWNLAIGSFPRATGRFETLHSSDGCREVTGQVQQDRCWFGYGVTEIAAHPRHWLSLIPAKLGYTFDSESFAVDYLREASPSSWPDERAAAARDLTTLAHRLILCAAAFACVAYRPRGLAGAVQGGLFLFIGLLLYVGFTRPEPAFWPLAVLLSIVPWSRLPGAPPWPPALKLAAALFGTTVLTHAIFFGENRFHVVVTPVLCLMAAAALRSTGGRAPASGRKVGAWR